MSMLLRSVCLTLFSLFLFLSGTGATRAQNEKLSLDDIREIEHRDPQWLLVQPHLPDPATATAEKLEMTADVLRARRFPADALDYYLYALRRGGPEARLLNKLGITQLELRNVSAARVYFERVVHANKKDAQAWNNLGAAEYMNARYNEAISAYKRAIKLDKKSAVFHSNLGTAFFEQRNFKKARQQYEIAMQLNPEMSQHDGVTGVTAHMLSPEDRARYCFEMARLYAARGDDAELLRYLTMASEGGFDILKAMDSDKVMARYREDPRVLLLVKNAQALHPVSNSIADTKGELSPLSSAR